MAIANYNIASSNSEELLGVVSGSEVTFAKRIENLYRKANQKPHALVRVANLMTLEKCRLVIKTFLFSQFNYFALVWIVTVENLITNLIDYKKGFYALHTMIKAQLFISCSKKTNQ